MNVGWLSGMNWCSSSAPEHSVGKVGRSTAVLCPMVLKTPPTSRLRGSQKSKSVVKAVERGIGEGDGERDGQESMERRSEAWLAATEGGWIKTAGAISSAKEHYSAFNQQHKFASNIISRRTFIVK